MNYIFKSETNIIFPIKAINRHIIEFFQISLKCCGLTSKQDFIEQNYAIPNSCSHRSKNDQGMTITTDFEKGCVSALTDMFDRYTQIPFYVLPVLAALQLVGVVTGILLLLFLIRHDDWAQEDSELDSENDKNDRNAPIELPKPKLYRILKTSKMRFGIQFDYDEERRGHLIKTIDEGSNAQFSGITLGSRIIEIGGLIAQNVSVGEIKFKMDKCGNDLKVLVVEEEADKLYRQCFINT